MHADNTTLILDRSKKSLITSLEMTDDFYEVSGLRLNNTKTNAFWIGSITVVRMKFNLWGETLSGLDIKLKL